MYFFFNLLFIALLFLAPSNSQAAPPQKLKYDAIHEALVQEERDRLLYEANPLKPPDSIQENPIAQQDPQLLWIPGYWIWSKEHSDFIWVSGVWRRAPPGMQWIPGEWQQFEAGWVRLNGFWSPKPLNALQPLTQAPPAQIDEKVPPSPGKNYFWIQGYWKWDGKSQKYIWFSGRYEKFDPNWIFFPSRYEWRVDGYYFTDAFWDWPMQIRGFAYPALYITEAERKSYIYQQDKPLTANDVLEYFYPSWPSYLNFFHYLYFFHPQVWENTGVSPSWWRWESWWTFTPHDQWNLWWWWTHPGFPQPEWIDQQLASQIVPPPQSVIDFMKKFPTPPFISFNNYVLTQQELLAGLQIATGMPDGPILPTDPRELKNIQEVARSRTLAPSPTVLKPTGNPNQQENPPEKPNLGPSKDSLSAPPDRTRSPTKPPAPSLVKEAKPVAQNVAQDSRTRFFRVQPKYVRPSSQFISPPQDANGNKSPNLNSKRPYYPNTNQGYSLYQLPNPESPYPYGGPLPPYDPSRVPQSQPPRNFGIPVYPRSVYPQHGYQLPKLVPPSVPSIPSSPTSRYPQVKPQSYSSGSAWFGGEVVPGLGVGRPRTKPLDLNRYNRYQGHQPIENWPPKPQSLQDRGNFMSHPQPQRNPYAPSATDPTGRFD